MIDLHCHILPGVDDGAPDLNTALEMARMAWDSGVTAMVATPHCNLPRGQRGNYISRELAERFSRLRRELRQAGIPLQLYTGMEVFCTPDTEQLLLAGKLSTLAGSHYMLVEFYFDESAAYMTGQLEGLLRHGVIPLVAHPERYDPVQRDPELARRWREMGCALQLNKGSLLGSLGSRAETTSHYLLRRGLAQAVASDGHGVSHRTPHMGQVRRLLEALCQPEYVHILLEENPRRILRDQPLV